MLLLAEGVSFVDEDCILPMLTPLKGPSPGRFVYLSEQVHNNRHAKTTRLPLPSLFFLIVYLKIGLVSCLVRIDVVVMEVVH